MTADICPIAEVADYNQVLPPSVEVPMPPRFSFGTAPAPVMSAYYRARHLHGVGVYSGIDLAWCNGFIMDAAGSFLMGAAIQIHPETISRLTDAERHALRGSTPQDMAGVAAALVPPGNAYRIFGHWLVDILPKLAVLEAAGHNLGSLFFPVPDDTPAFARELMTLFGIPHDRIVAVRNRHKLVAQRLLVPASLHNGVRVSPLMREAAALFRRHMEQAGLWLRPPTDTPRIFLARRGRNRALVNRDRVEEMARQAGFVIIYPEDRSLTEQFALFAGAREILGEYGSAFHSSLFSPPGTVVCGLRGDQVHPAFIQSGMGAVLDQPTGYVFGEGQVGDYDFTIAENSLVDCLDTVFDSKHGLGTALPSTQPDQSQAGAEPRRAGIATYLSRLLRRPRRMDAAEPLGAGPPIRTEPRISVVAHLRSRGDTPAGPDGWAGLPGSGLAVEGVLISVFPPSVTASLSYQTMSADGSLSGRVRGGVYCGTRGQNTPVSGIVVHADAAIVSEFSVSVEGCFVDGSRCGPMPEGVLCRSKSGSPLEALRVVLDRGRRPPGLHTLLTDGATTN